MSIVAVYGGGFNPPHVGHAMIGSWILSTGRAEEILLVPCADHPFGKEMLPFEHRVELCEWLIEDMGWFTYCSRIEATMAKPNYTINMLRQLRSEHPEHEFRFVMGADNVAKREQWFGFDDIVAEFNPIFVNRPAAPLLDPKLYGVSPVFPDISSTEIRQRLREGQPVSHLLTQNVLLAIREEGWYTT